MNFFGELFNRAEQKQDGLITNKDINAVAKQFADDAITTTGQSDSHFVTPIRSKAEFFDCYSCKCRLQILPHQQSVKCGFCEQENEVYRVQDSGNYIDSWQTKGRPVTIQSGKTTDDNDIIDISYQEV